MRCVDLRCPRHATQHTTCVPCSAHFCMISEIPNSANVSRINKNHDLAEISKRAQTLFKKQKIPLKKKHCYISNSGIKKSRCARCKPLTTVIFPSQIRCFFRPKGEIFQVFPPFFHPKGETYLGSKNLQNFEKQKTLS